MEWLGIIAFIAGLIAFDEITDKIRFDAFISNGGTEQEFKELMQREQEEEYRQRECEREEADQEMRRRDDERNKIEEIQCGGGY